MNKMHFVINKKSTAKPQCLRERKKYVCHYIVFKIDVKKSTSQVYTIFLIKH